MARGLSQGHGIFNCGLVCPTFKLITPSKALVVVELLHQLIRYKAIAQMITGISSGKLECLFTYLTLTTGVITGNIPLEGTRVLNNNLPYR